MKRQIGFAEAESLSKKRVSLPPKNESLAEQVNSSKENNDDKQATQAASWRILSNRRSTVDTLNSVGAHSEMHTALLPTEGYIPLFEPH